MPNKIKILSKRTRKFPSKFEDFQLSSTFDRKEVQTRTIKASKRKYTSQMDGQTLFSHSKRITAVKKRAKKDDKKLLKIKQYLSNIGIDNMTVDEYIPSPADLSDTVAVKIVDLLKDIPGRGLFAHIDIEKGTCIGFYTGEEYASNAEFERYLSENPGADNSYAMTVGRRIIDAATKGNFTRYINFSDSQDNVEFRETTRNGVKVVEVVALKDIRQGQQILVNYNTYNENASKLYYFLNPGDGWLSANELYEQNKASYHLWTMSGECEAFNINNNEEFLINRVASAVFANQLLTHLKDVNRTEIDLPILKMNSFKEILDFKDADTFTSLMMACYLGQSENVNWLIRRGANVDQQQNLSGKCPLFFALSGYSSEQDNKSNYLSIMSSLIKNRANLRVHDRADRTFLHKAIEILSDNDFQKILITIKTQTGSQFNELYNYIDENNFDIVLFGLKTKQLDKVQLLLEANPEYFNQYVSQGKAYLRNEIELFKAAIQDYDQEELTILYQMLGEEGLNLPNDLLERLINNLQLNRFCLMC
ncbi:Dot/Icm T4SS effector AnkI/LegAS4 [Legionella bononiensis]|uniref:SET domain-containing protein-lysine N-methyltransferase n=1 Tax=Legionella bononiensis TaxID=2793102 RepID=A0ABS1WB66_9GAMM|nr:Dot/Icm T4SS effector AnkI/LegAS4 [Legionella bononiensis]MBL7480176.1 SET domain-containing protein-lysine N-methyltransferase [Legionella bononiensis]MBL7526593.1 SET domain-containing protein-lysine N-methyltransferase [Legionella bononiensis]MBL7562913.1 SET domain-containing protein-lysine N-methyltransferase [Legionella bononiensis]